MFIVQRFANGGGVNAWTSALVRPVGCGWESALSSIDRFSGQ